MAEHTGGIWTIEDIIYADHIALEAHVGDKILLIAADEYEEHGGGPTPEQAANFRLLSTAPDLLGACEAHEEAYMHQFGCPACTDFQPCEFYSVLRNRAHELGRAAIAKAKDGQ